MKAKRSFLILGLFTTAGVVTVSCGGSDSSNGNGSAGSSNTSAGTTSKAGTTSSSAGTSSATAGTANNTGGTANNNGGSGNNNGGRNNNGGVPGLPNLGGAFEIAACTAGTMTGGACTPVEGTQNACQLNDTTYCACGSGDNPTWFCVDTGDFGGGGDGPGLGQATCPADAMTGDTCTGIGVCSDQDTCICYMDSVTCR